MCFQELLIGSKERESSQALSDLQHSLDTTKHELGVATGMADARREEVEQVNYKGVGRGGCYQA